MDSEEDAAMCSGGSKISDVKIKKEPQSSERTCREIKPELDSDDALQNQRVPLYSIMEYKNPDVTSDDCAVDMKTEIKEETWWDGSISPDKFQPELLLSHGHIRSRDVEESLHESETTTSHNEAAVIPASYAWHPFPARVQRIKAPKYRSKNVGRAICELRQLQGSVNKHISQNQFDIFGRSVASQLKTIQYYKALQAQSQIQALLTNTAMETFRSSKS